MSVNTTATNTTYTHHVHPIPLSTHITVASLITILNSIVIFIYISMKRKMKTIPNYLMFAQALVDLYQAALAWYETVVDALDKSEEKIYSTSLMDVLYAGMLEYSLSLCLLTLTLAAIERHLCIAKPFFHRKFITKTRITYGTVLVYITSTVPAVILTACAKFEQRNLNSPIVVMYSYFYDIFMFLLILFVVMTLSMSLKVGKNSINSGIHKQMELMSFKSTEKCEETLKRVMKKKLRLVVIFSIMMAAFLVSVLPYAIGRLCFDAGMLNTWSSSNQYLFLSICHVVYKCSSLFNPVLTLTLKEDYRKKFLKLFSSKQKYGVSTLLASKTALFQLAVQFDLKE